jgi:hypothetical protein
MHSLLEQAKNKAANTPKLKAEMTSELVPNDMCLYIVRTRYGCRAA